MTINAALGLSAMEIDNQVISFKIPEIPHSTDNIDFVKMWGRLNCEINRKQKNTKNIILLVDQLKVLTSVDKPFLTESQKQDWKQIFNAMGGSSCGSFASLFNEENSEYIEQFFNELDDYAYPLNAHRIRLQTIKWAKEKVRTSGWELIWPDILEIKKDSADVVRTFTPDEIRETRLAVLKKKRNKALGKLEMAKLTAPEKLPTLFTKNINDLWCSFNNKTIAHVCEKVDLDGLKTVFMYLNVSMGLDFEWFNGEQREALEQMLFMADKEIWEKEVDSKMYYRWYVAVINQLEKHIQNNGGQDLSWLKRVLPKEIPAVIESCPSVENLKNARLAALAVFKKEALEHFNDYKKRPRYKNRAQKTGNDDCAII